MMTTSNSRSRFPVRCSKCEEINTATFCSEETCRRKFMPLPGYSTEFCPLHDPTSLSYYYRVRELKNALYCRQCGHNVFGVKPEDLENGRPLKYDANGIEAYGESDDPC